MWRHRKGLFLFLQVTLQQQVSMLSNSQNSLPSFFPLKNLSIACPLDSKICRVNPSHFLIATAKIHRNKRREMQNDGKEFKISPTYLSHSSNDETKGEANLSNKGTAEYFVCRNSIATRHGSPAAHEDQHCRSNKFRHQCSQQWSLAFLQLRKPHNVFNFLAHFPALIPK